MAVSSRDEATYRRYPFLLRDAVGWRRDFLADADRCAGLEAVALEALTRQLEELVGLAGRLGLDQQVSDT